MNICCEVLYEDEKYEYGITIEKTSTGTRHLGKWMRYKRDLWFNKKPQQILEEMGIRTTVAKANDFASLIDGNIDGFSYLSEATDRKYGDEALKWIMGPLAAKMKESNVCFCEVGYILPAHYLKTFVGYLMEERFPRHFAKDVFERLLDNKYYTHDARDVLDSIIALPDFKEEFDDQYIIRIIDDVITHNHAQFIKAKTEQKLLNWFIGQVKKIDKKVSTEVIRRILNDKLEEKNNND